MPPTWDTPSRRRTTVLTAVFACLAVGLGGVLTAAPASAQPAYDPSGLETQLLGQLQQDRWQQGLGGLAVNGTLAAFARSAPFQACPGVTAHGRAEDMVERNYFSHQVPPCGAEAWVPIRAAGLPMQAWAENIAWSQGSGAATVGVVNSGFMSSPGHRANILGDYNSVGVGAWPAVGTWTGGGSALNGVVVFAVIFARVPGGGGPPPPRAAPPPAVAAPPAAPTVIAAAPPAPPAPPASPPAAYQVRDTSDRIRAELRTIVGRPPPLRATQRGWLGPAWLGGLAIGLVLVLGTTTALGAAFQERRRTPHK